MLWSSVKDSRDPALLQAYLDQFPHGTFAGAAKVMIEELKRSQATAPPAKPKTAPAAPAAAANEEAEGASKQAHNGVEASDQSRKQFVELSGVEKNAPGVVIVGARAREPNDGVAAQAAKQLLADIIASLRHRGVAANELEPKVYGSGYFDAMMRGGSAVIRECRMAQRIRSAVLALVDASCRQTAWYWVSLLARSPPVCASSNPIRGTHR